MRLHIPAHIQAIPAYVPGKPVEEVERERGIRNAIKLASNENPLGPSPMAAAAVRAASAHVHRYPESGGYELTRKLAVRLGLAPGNIVLGNGSDDIIVMLATAFLQPGDEVILARPSFQMYEIVTRAAGATPVEVPLAAYRNDLAAVFAQLEKETLRRIRGTPKALFKQDFDVDAWLFNRQKWRGTFSDVTGKMDGAVVFAAGERLTPGHLGVLASLGVARPRVRRRRCAREHRSHPSRLRIPRRSRGPRAARPGLCYTFPH